MISSCISLGKFSITGIRDGFFHLDGGAVFGVVPKIIWENLFSADSQNRIRLGLNCLVVKTPSAVILIDTGVGAFLKQSWLGFYEIERESGLIPELAKLGILPSDVDFVINTHLHFDHCGGNTRKGEDGVFVPSFPKAEYILQKCEYENAVNPKTRDKPSYIPDFFLPLERDKCLRTVEGTISIVEGVEVVPAAGHTAGHQAVKISSLGETLFFLGDMVPTSAHVGLPYIMSYDLFPMQTLHNKEKFFKQAVNEKWLLAFDHDPYCFFGSLLYEKMKFNFVEMTSSLKKQ